MASDKGKAGGKAGGKVGGKATSGKFVKDSVKKSGATRSNRPNPGPDTGYKPPKPDR